MSTKIIMTMTNALFVGAKISKMDKKVSSKGISISERIFFNGKRNWNSILDDVSPEQFADYIDQIDSTGESNIHVTRDGHDVIWDYRHFNLECENALLKYGIDRVRRAYEGESEE